MCSQHRQLRLFLGLERAGIVEHFAVAVAEDVGGEPAAQAEHARLEAGREDGLHQRLAGLVVLAADRRFVSACESACIAGMSTVRFGAPLAKGTPSFSAA